MTPRKTSWIRVAIYALLFVALVSAQAQLASSSAPVTATDPPAEVSATKYAASLAAVSALAAAHGWLPAQLPRDVVISGTVTRHMGASESPDDPSANFTVKLRNPEHSGNLAPTQLSYTEAGSTFLTNGLAGAIISASGKAMLLPAHSAAGALGMLFPAFSVISDFASADVAITPLGQKTLHGDACTGVHIERKFADSDTAGKVKALVAPIDLWISNATGHLVRADYLRIAADNHYAALRETAYFSDYRLVNGMAVAFQQEILLDDDHIKTIKFSTVQVNTGLTDTDFNVASVLGGAR